MAITISTADARTNLSDIINRVAYGNELVVLTRRGKNVAALVSMEELELLQRIEDRLDVEDANKAVSEQGESIPAEEVWKLLGL